MDVLGVIGTAAGLAALIVGAWQLRVAVLDRRDNRTRQAPDTTETRRPTDPAESPQALAVPDAAPPVSASVAALPVSAPLGRLPDDVIGREELLLELRAALTRPAPGTFVLAGMGGVGKSTVALQLAAETKRQGHRVWWVSAADPSSLQGGLLEVLYQLDAPADLVTQLREGSPTAADHFWTFLQTKAQDSLLILDNADLPAVLSRDGTSPPADGTGWIRPDASVLTVVTTRTADPQTWGNGIQLRQLKVLTTQQAALVLRNLAPSCPDPTGSESESLAQRLGSLPLALHLAGTYLASPFASWRGFEEYRNALDSEERHKAVGDLDLGDDSRRTISRTWEFSLDALDQGGLPDARRLLYLLACFAPSIPLPGSILPAKDGRSLVVLKGLAAAALIDLEPAIGYPAITVHPVIADTCRTHLVADGDGSGELLTSAVQMMVGAAAGLSAERSSDRPSWQALLPHLEALLAWAAPYLTEEAAAALLELSADAFGSLWLNDERSGLHAEELAQSMLAVARRLPPDHPAALRTRYCAGCALGINSRHAEAEPLLQNLVIDLKRVLGEGNEYTLQARDELAGAVLALDRYAEAEQLYRELVSDQEFYLALNHQDTLATKVDLAWTLGQQGRYEEAAALCREVLAAYLSTLEAEHSRTLDAWGDLVRWTTAEGNPVEAERLGTELVEIEQRVLGPRHPLTSFNRATLAAAIAAQGRFAEAEPIFAEVLPELDRSWGPDDYRTIVARADYAAALIAAGRNEETAAQRSRVVE